MLPHPLTEPRHLQHILCRVGRLRGMREEDHILLAMLKDAANYGKNSLKVRKKGGGKGGGKVDLAAVGPQVNYGIDPEPNPQPHLYRTSDRRTGLDSGMLDMPSTRWALPGNLPHLPMCHIHTLRSLTIPCELVRPCTARFPGATATLRCSVSVAPTRRVRRTRPSEEWTDRTLTL